MNSLEYNSEELDFKEIGKKKFGSNKELFDFLLGLGCDTSRLSETDGIIYYPASGKPGGLKYELIKINSKGEIEFELVASMLLKNIIEGLRKTEEQWIAEEVEKLKFDKHRFNMLLSGYDILSSGFQGNNTPLTDEKRFFAFLDKKLKHVELLEDEICGILKRRRNGRGWIIDTSYEAINEKNLKEGFKGKIPIIHDGDAYTLGIGDLYKEGDFVIARIENNKIIEIFSDNDF
ncbi:MAG: hypothetical protein PHN31_04875 [Candidatus Gracilibacteria bacterium]|nr:hypothetical protein [Candidatus Gracilibacteria bacterium]